MATTSLLGLGNIFMRMVMVKPTDNTDESEKAFVGNAILVAQPTPETIASELQPTEAEQSSYFNGMYGSSSNQAMLGNSKALTIDRQEYLEIA